jgi:hypothetical protein
MRQRDETGRFVRVPMEDRFWEKVDRRGGPRACWWWLGPIEWTGYGRFTDYWTKHYAHRWAYEFLVGPIPSGKQVLHTCDNPACVNPAHLRVGTASDNMQDASLKGRMRRRVSSPGLRGEANPRHKLTAAQVAEIRRRYIPRGPGRPRTSDNRSPSVRALAKEYSVAHSLIHRIVTNEVWSHE